MINHVDQSLHDLLTIGFPCIFEGRGVKVIVTRVGDHYEVNINGEFVDEVMFDENSYSWYSVHDDINDFDLVKEIGVRIEAKYN
jgi:S-adenosylmethionine synthetase